MIGSIPVKPNTNPKKLMDNIMEVVTRQERERWAQSLA